MEVDLCHPTEHNIKSYFMEDTHQLLQIPCSKSRHDQNQSPFLLWELSLLTNQSDFPPLSGSISFHNKNQFSVTLSSPVKVNSPLTYIFKCLPLQQQPNPAHSQSLWIDLVHPQANKINKIHPHSPCRTNFPIPAQLCLPSSPIPFLPPWHRNVSALLRALQKLWSPSITSLPRFYSSLSLSYSLFQIGSNPRTHIPFFFPLISLLSVGSLTHNSFPVQ